MQLEWRNLGKRFGRRIVFSGLCGVVRTGEVLIVTGPNGSGKTTFLRVLAGLTRPHAGEAVMMDNGSRTPVSECHGDIGFLTPDLALYVELSARENLSFFSRVRGMGLSQEDIVAHIGKFGLVGRDDDLLGSFSSGMKQRMKLAFATLHAPRILLLDEPGSNLDSTGEDIVRNLIHSQRERGICIVATNDERERSYGDAVLQLGANRGQ